MGIVLVREGTCSLSKTVDSMVSPSIDCQMSSRGGSQSTIYFCKIFKLITHSQHKKVLYIEHLKQIYNLINSSLGVSGNPHFKQEGI